MSELPEKPAGEGPNWVPAVSEGDDHVPSVDKGIPTPDATRPIPSRLHKKIPRNLILESQLQLVAP